MQRVNSQNIFVISVLVPLALLGALTASSSHSSPDISVTSTLNVAGSIVPDPGTNYRIEGDGNGQYYNGVSSVSSVLQGSSGDWILDTTSSRTRTILIDLRQPVAGSNVQQIFAYEYSPVRIIVKCSEAISGSFSAMKLNQTLSCPTGISFQYAGVSYGLMMSSGPNSDIDYVETNNSRVTCTGLNSSASQCNAWTIAPIQQANGPIENIARLRQPLRNGFANLGDFYVTFNWNITNP